VIWAKSWSEAIAIAGWRTLAQDKNSCHKKTGHITSLQQNRPRWKTDTTFANPLSQAHVSPNIFVCNRFACRASVALSDRVNLLRRAVRYVVWQRNIGPSRGGKEGKFSRLPRRSGAPASLRNIKYTRMRSPYKENSTRSPTVARIVDPTDCQWPLCYLQANAQLPINDQKQSRPYISHRLATTAHNRLQSHPRSMIFI